MRAPEAARICSVEQNRELLHLVRTGQLFEIMDWVRDGNPTLMPPAINRKTSPIHNAIDRCNHSMTRYLWEHAHQTEDEVDSLFSGAIGYGSNAQKEIARYFLAQHVPLNVSASEVFKTLDDELIQAVLEDGISVRGDCGFSWALIETGCCKPLIRIFRKFKGQYPELNMEAFTALRHCVEEGKLRGAALLVWAGVDPLQQLRDDPYDDSELDEYNRGRSLLDEIQLDGKALELLKVLKVELTAEIWLKFFELSCWLNYERAAEVFNWVKNGEEILRENPEKAAKIFWITLQYARESQFGRSGGERIKLELCEWFACQKVPCLLCDDQSYDFRSLRRGCSEIADKKKLVRLLWVIFEMGDQAQHDRLKELVRTPKMMAWVKEFDPQLLRDLSLGSKRERGLKTPESERPWQRKTYIRPNPFS